MLGAFSHEHHENCNIKIRRYGVQALVMPDSHRERALFTQFFTAYCSRTSLSFALNHHDQARYVVNTCFLPKSLWYG